MVEAAVRLGNFKTKQQVRRTRHLRGGCVGKFARVYYPDQRAGSATCRDRVLDTVFRLPGAAFLEAAGVRLIAGLSHGHIAKRSSRPALAAPLAPKRFCRFRQQYTNAAQI